MASFVFPPPFPRPSLRSLLLGRRAIHREHNLFLTCRRAERVAITRGIVIFADYLSDLIVVNISTDIITTNHPTSILLALLGATSGFLAADLLSGIGAWLSTRHIPKAFDLFQNPISNPDVFDALVNACFLVTPPLTILSCWAAHAEGQRAIFIESLLVSVLSSLALAPAVSRLKDCALLRALRAAGLVKTRRDGWCRISGLWDGALATVIPILDRVASRMSTDEKDTRKY